MRLPNDESRKSENPKFRNACLLSQQQQQSRIVNLADVERIALPRLPLATREFYRSGAGDELTLGENCRAFNQLRIRPRFLRDMSHRDTSTTILGIPVAFPVCVAPSSMQRVATPMGEIANALGKLGIL